MPRIAQFSLARALIALAPLLLAACATAMGGNSDDAGRAGVADTPNASATSEASATPKAGQNFSRACAKTGSCTGLTGYQVVWNSGTVGDNGGSFTVYCPDGQVAIGGGGEVVGDGLTLSASKPLGGNIRGLFGLNGVASGWQVVATGQAKTPQPTGLPINPISVYAFCVDAR
ncbi:MAG: hypothetical protein FJX22_02100 [Alphaproteobacteria bacterium]|nr:hypothetical protein [Alphaproteobacteria bacterium]